MNNTTNVIRNDIIKERTTIIEDVEPTPEPYNHFKFRETDNWARLLPDNYVSIDHFVLAHIEDEIGTDLSVVDRTDIVARHDNDARFTLEGIFDECKEIIYNHLSNFGKPTKMYEVKLSYDFYTEVKATDDEDAIEKAKDELDDMIFRRDLVTSEFDAEVIDEYDL